MRVTKLVAPVGPDKNQFLEEIKKLDLEKNILTLGKVPNDEVIKIMFITDLYLLPSEEEGMSHSLMEAFATGTPAVAFDVGGTKEMYPESLQYLVLDLGNVDSFSKKTLEILNNREKAEGIGKLLKEKIKKYDKNIVLDEFVNKVIS
jgi:glycosyltransferase involved in cell wall biosynthesis